MDWQLENEIVIPQPHPILYEWDLVSPVVGRTEQDTTQGSGELGKGIADGGVGSGVEWRERGESEGD